MRRKAEEMVKQNCRIFKIDTGCDHPVRGDWDGIPPTPAHIRDWQDKGLLQPVSRIQDLCASGWTPFVHYTDKEHHSVEPF